MTTELSAAVHDGRQSADAEVLRTDFRVLKVALWSVAAYCVLGLVGFAVLAGFWPPPAEHLSAVDIAAYFRDHNTSIRVGLVMMAAGAPFYFIWSAVLSKIIGRIEGPMGVLSTVELLGGLLTAIVTLVPPTIWLGITISKLVPV